jgi:hypothetical protein
MKNTEKYLFEILEVVKKDEKLMKRISKDKENGLREATVSFIRDLVAQYIDKTQMTFNERQEFWNDDYAKLIFEKI